VGAVAAVGARPGRVRSSHSSEARWGARGAWGAAATCRAVTQALRRVGRGRCLQGTYPAGALSIKLPVPRGGPPPWRSHARQWCPCGRQASRPLPARRALDIHGSGCLLSLHLFSAREPLPRPLMSSSICLHLRSTFQLYLPCPRHNMYFVPPPATRPRQAGPGVLARPFVADAGWGELLLRGRCVAAAWLPAVQTVSLSPSSVSQASPLLGGTHRQRDTRLFCPRHHHLGHQALLRSPIRTLCDVHATHRRTYSYKLAKQRLNSHHLVVKLLQTSLTRTSTSFGRRALHALLMCSSMSLSRKSSTGVAQSSATSPYVSVSLPAGFLALSAQYPKSASTSRRNRHRCCQ